MTYPSVNPSRSRRRSAGSILAFGAAGCGGTIAVGLVALMVALSTMDFGGCVLTTGDIGPGKGTRSRRLRVDVSPREGLDAGTVVTVTSDAFDAQDVVGVAVCLREADLDAEGVDACDTTSGYRYATDRDGHLRASFPVPRVITVGGKAYDCARTASHCIVVAADASDFDRSGGQTIAFRADLAPVDAVASGARPASDLLPVAGKPGGPVAAGTPIEVSAMGFQPGEPLLIARCAGFPDHPAFDACQPLDSTVALGAIMGRTVERVPDVAKADGTFTTHVTATRTVEPYRGPTTGAVQCTSAAARCSIVVAAAADTRRSAVLPYQVVA
jgi:hypothetical protein